MRILIADDEAIIRIGLKAMLQEMGHEVVASAADGASAIRFARALDPDLVILDIKMPEVDGLAAAEAIAALRPVPIVMLTAYSDRDLVSRAAHLPIQAYLVKPVQPGDLSAALQLAAQRFSECQALHQEAAELRDALETRDLVEKAKEALMHSKGLTEEAAFRFLQSRARRQRRPLREIAGEILERGL